MPRKTAKPSEIESDLFIKRAEEAGMDPEMAKAIVEKKLAYERAKGQEQTALVSTKPIRKTTKKVFKNRAKRPTVNAESVALMPAPVTPIAVLPTEMRQLPLRLTDVAVWPKEMRGLPNHYLRAGIFTVGNKTKARKNFVNAPVFSLNPAVDIHYTGVELRAEDDELVLAQVIDFSKNVPIGNYVYFTFSDLCKELGWSRNSTYYRKAEDCLVRLQATAVTITSEELGCLKSVSFIKGFEVLHRGTKKACICVEIDPLIIKLYEGQQYSRLVWGKYRRLTPIARRMYDYVASHKTPYPIAIEAFKHLCGSETKKTNKWREQVKKACSELMSSQLLNTAFLESDDRVYFKR